MWYLTVCMYVNICLCSVCGCLGRHVSLVSGYFCRLCFVEVEGWCLVCEYFVCC